MEQLSSEKCIEIEESHGAKNYKPLDIVLAKGEGVWVEDVEGKRYLDGLSAYSALNQGHRHPRIVEALTQQAARLTLTSRAFRNDQLPRFYQTICQISGMQMVLPMNTGAEAVETAIKAARKWGYQKKGIPKDAAEIIVCEGNFHGRTTTIVSCSTEEQYRADFGPFTPGFRVVPYGDLEALRAAITPNTCAFLFEPIQGEAGVVIPPAGYLAAAAELCNQQNVLFVADEIQTGLGRTGRMFCCEHDDLRPDLYIVGKALGGGVYPISAVLGSREVLGLFKPGDHGSTFGGNPLGCAVAVAALEVLVEEKLVERSAALGETLLARLRRIKNPSIVEIRGRGLFIGIEFDHPVRPYCEALMREGLLCKETHSTVIRFAPPLTISEEDLDWAVERLERVL